MKKVNRKFCFNLFVLIPILLVMCISFRSTQVFAANNIPEATEEFYVNDFAGIFTDSQKIEMIEKAEELASIGDYGYQVVVTTVKTLNGEILENYSIKMAEQYKIGKDGHGILILLVTEDRKIRVEVGVGMEDLFTDSKMGRFVDKYAIPDLANNRFAEGIMKLQKAIIEEITNNVKVSTETPKVTPTPQNNIVPKTNNTSDNDIGKDFWAATSFLLSLVGCGTVFIFINNRHEKNEKRKEELKNAIESVKNAEKEVFRLSEDNEKLQKEISQYGEKVISYQQELSYLKQHHSETNKQFETIQKNYHSLKNEKEHLEKTLENLSERYNRAKVLHPNLDKEIDEMIEREIEEANRSKAKEFDEKASIYLNKEPEANSELISSLYGIINEYEDDLNSEQRRFSNTDINKIKDLLNKCENLKKQERVNRISELLKKVVSNKSSGREVDLHELYEARNRLAFEYDVINLVDQELISKLERLIKEGEEERKNRILNEKADQVLKQIERELSYNRGTENRLPEMYEAKKAFDNADSDVQNLIDTNLVSKLSKFIAEGEEERKNRILQEKADLVIKQIERELSYNRGTENRLPEMYEAKKAFDNADSDVQNLIDTNLVSKLSKFIAEGEEKKKKRIEREEEEEEERRRRNSSYYSSSYSSNFHHSSSYSSSSHRSSTSHHHNSGMGGGFRGGGSSRSL